MKKLPFNLIIEVLNNVIDFTCNATNDAKHEKWYHHYRTSRKMNLSELIHLRFVIFYQKLFIITRKYVIYIIIKLPPSIGNFIIRTIRTY